MMAFPDPLADDINKAWARSDVAAKKVDTTHRRLKTKRSGSDTL